MIIFFQVFTRTAPPPQLSLEDSPYPQNAAMFISSIARTNLECDIVQRGGTLVQGRGFADMVAAFNKASTSGATPKVAKMTFDSNRNKFCFGESLIIFMISIAEYGHTMAKSLNLCGPNPNRFGCKGLVFCRINGWLMEYVDKELTVSQWKEIPHMPQSLAARIVCPSAEVWDFDKKNIGRP